MICWQNCYWLCACMLQVMIKLRESDKYGQYVKYQKSAQVHNVWQWMLVLELWLTCVGEQYILHIVIPHLEMRACDWSKSCHVTFTKSGYFRHEAILPPFVYVNSASNPWINIASMSSLIFLNNSSNHSTEKSKSQFSLFAYISSKYGIILMKLINF